MKKKIIILMLFVCVILFFQFGSAKAQVPHTLSYQGVLTDTLGHARPDGEYSFTFRIYASENNGTALWSETKVLTLNRGLFNTYLGDVEPIKLKFDVPYWLSIQIANDPELSPRIPLSSTGYSLHSINSDTALFARTAPQQAFIDSARIAGIVPDNSITSSKIINGSIQRVDVVNNFQIWFGKRIKSTLSPHVSTGDYYICWCCYYA